MDLIETAPDGLGTGFAVALAVKEATDLGVQPHDIIQSGRLDRQFLFGEEMSAGYFIRVKEQRCNAPRPLASARTGITGQCASFSRMVVFSRPLAPTSARRRYGFGRLGLSFGAFGGHRRGRFCVTGFQEWPAGQIDGLAL